ncbi:General stress protein 16O [Anaerohalosphaera lusitana]|uniref:General stress protein 16O n=1 Tax=Anaerohalosphaera lusitana TaxID=1936003 RepID=A0A1U9NPL5_9BACT|nr:TraR/DksA C4-type zinc finger protein [Anaerohalosphaera lusitana]AQT69727.1 General stress protein 16O [Anaerohalosphaera lusitana]
MAKKAKKTSKGKKKTAKKKAVKKKVAKKKAKKKKAVKKKTAKKKKKKAKKAAKKKAKGASMKKAGKKKASAKKKRRTKKTHLTAADLRKYRELLLIKRKELFGDVNSIESGALRTSGRDSTGNLSNMPIHMADLGSDNFEQDFALGLMDSERKLLYEIDSALQRIEDKTYGICEGTGQPIPKARLNASPWARYCVQYQEMVEKGLVEEGEMVDFGEKETDLDEETIDELEEENIYGEEGFEEDEEEDADIDVENLGEYGYEEEEEY